MRFILCFLMLSLCVSFAFADFSLNLQADKESYLPGEMITLKTSFQPKADMEIWDTYLFFLDSRLDANYIIVASSNTLEPTPLGMLPSVMQLKPAHWKRDEVVRFFLCICKANTEEVLATATTTVKIAGNPSIQKPKLPVSPQLLLVQEICTEPTDRYTDYKQFDSQWKNVLLNQGPKTIGEIGCAMTAAGNIIGWTPSTLNTHLKNNGGYSGNLLIWGKIPNVSFKGTGTVSDSLFSSYHVIADVGGHFVLLTGTAGSGKYNCKDPGKSSNPVYTTSQIYGVRLYYK